MSNVIVPTQNTSHKPAPRVGSLRVSILVIGMAAVAPLTSSAAAPIVHKSSFLNNFLFNLYYLYCVLRSNTSIYCASVIYTISVFILINQELQLASENWLSTPAFISTKSLAYISGFQVIVLKHSRLRSRYAHTIDDCLVEYNIYGLKI